MELLLRLFANCDDDAAASEISRRMELALSRWAPEPFAAPKRYWKDQTQFEFAYKLSPATEDSLQAILSASSGGWHQISRDDVVWNRVRDHMLLVPEVSWAHAELYETNP